MPKVEYSAEDWAVRILVALGINYQRVSHVIIDLEVGKEAVFYITYHGAKGLAHVRPPSANAGKVIITKEEG